MPWRTLYDEITIRAYVKFTQNHIIKQEIEKFFSRHITKSFFVQTEMLLVIGYEIFAIFKAIFKFCTAKNIFKSFFHGILL